MCYPYTLLTFYLVHGKLKVSYVEEKTLSLNRDDVEKQKHLLAELLDKNQLYVNLVEIEDADFAVSEADELMPSP